MSEAGNVHDRCRQAPVQKAIAGIHRAFARGCAEIRTLAHGFAPHLTQVHRTCCRISFTQREHPSQAAVIEGVHLREHTLGIGCDMWCRVAVVVQFLTELLQVHSFRMRGISVAIDQQLRAGEKRREKSHCRAERKRNKTRPPLFHDPTFCAPTGRGGLWTETASAAPFAMSKVAQEKREFLISVDNFHFLSPANGGQKEIDQPTYRRSLPG